MWFAHGDGPTSADYMMLFPLEALASHLRGAGAGLEIPHIKQWVKTVHER
jgi:glutathione S-transferase